MNKKRTIIAIVGRAVSGKDTVGKYLADNYGFTHISTGQLVRDYIAEMNLGEPTRDLMIYTANDVRSKYGVDYFVQKALDLDTDRLVIDGLRTVGEISAAREAGSMVIAIEAPIEKRFEWATGRGRASDRISFEDFARQEKLESTNKSASAQSVDEVINLSDYVIKNEADLSSLFTQLDGLMKEMDISK